MGMITSESERSDSITTAFDEKTFSSGWSSDLLAPIGCVGTIANWIVKNSGVPQPKFALAAALTSLGAILGRHVRDITGQRTNIYCLCLGNSSAGKDRPYILSQRLVYQVGMGRLIVGEFTSDSALEHSLSHYPKRFLILDEVGDYIGSVKAKNSSNPYLPLIIPMLKKIWSRANGDYCCKSRTKNQDGKWEEAVKLHEPCVSIYGTGSPNRLYETLTESDFEDGAFPRFLAFHVDGGIHRYSEVPDNGDVPTSLLNEVKAIMSEFNITPTDQPTTTISCSAPQPAARVIPQTDKAKHIFDDFESVKCNFMAKAQDDPIYYTWGKALEQARRIALIVACTRNPSSPVVDEYDANYAVRLVSQITNETVQYLLENFASSKAEFRFKKLTALIKRAGDKGIILGDLTRRTQHLFPNYLARKEMLRELQDAGVIEEISIPGKGKKAINGYKFIGEDFK